MSKLKIFLLIIVIGAAIFTVLILTRGLKQHYKAAVALAQLETPPASGIIEARDMEHLPEVVKKYLVYTGSVGREKIRNFRVVWHGALRADAQSHWMSATIVQENFFHDYTRDFYLTALMKGLPVSVWHSYHNASASMQVKILSLFSLVSIASEDLTIAETVTLLNDICLVAPGALIDRRISWRLIDKLSAEATLTNGKYRVSGVLKFNDKGELVDFTSTDRLMLGPDNKLRRERWSTPVGEYKEFAGRRLMSRGEAIWHLPQGNLTYGKLVLKTIEYNVH